MPSCPSPHPHIFSRSDSCWTGKWIITFDPATGVDNEQFSGYFFERRIEGGEKEYETLNPKLSPFEGMEKKMTESVPGNHGEFEGDYWIDRGGMEPKHYIEAYVWCFTLRPGTVLDYGCGRGERVAAFRFLQMPAWGYDISKTAVGKAITAAKKYLSTEMYYGEFDLVVCYDVLEHLEQEELSEVLENIYNLAKKDVIFSICLENDPNFDKDSSHKIKQDRDWWNERLEREGFKIKSVPDIFPFQFQMFLSEVEK